MSEEAKLRLELLDLREVRARQGWCVILHDHGFHMWPVDEPIQIAG